MINIWHKFVGMDTPHQILVLCYVVQAVCWAYIAWQLLQLLRAQNGKK